MDVNKSVLALALALILYPQLGNARSCISPDQLNTVLSQLRKSTVRFKATDGSVGTGFILNSAAGPELVSAHHVLVKSTGGKPCGGADSRIPNPSHLNSARLLFNEGQPVRELKSVQFPTDAANMDFSNDLIKMRLSGLFQGLDADAADESPGMNEDIVLAGYSDGGGSRRFNTHTCQFHGFSSSIRSDWHPHYKLTCTDVNYDLEGMSGSMAISKCTGKVVGALSGQNFEKQCRTRGDATDVAVAPVSITNAGQIKFGVQTQVASRCFYRRPGTTRDDLQQACSVGPAIFPPVSTAVASGPRPSPVPVTPTGTNPGGSTFSFDGPGAAR